MTSDRDDERGTPPPAGGFGAAADQPTEIAHRAVAPQRPSNALHTVFIVLGCLVLAMLVLVLWGEWKKEKMSRGAEALVELSEIAKGVRANYEATGELCPSARAVPADFEQVRAKRYTSRIEEWQDDPGWACVGFTMSRSQRYQYRLETSGNFVTIIAAGDFDGDDIRATYELHGHVEADKQLVVFEGAIRESNPGE